MYIDHWAGAQTELAGLGKLGVEFKGEIGGVITGDLSPPPLDQVTVFQSLGNSNKRPIFTPTNLMLFKY